MRRLIVGLIDSPNPQALHQALHWLYGFVRPHRLAIAGLLAYGLSNGLGYFSIMSIGQTLAGPRAAGKWMGLQNGFAGLAGMISPVVTGFSIDATGDYRIAFLIAAALAVAGMAAWGVIIPRIAPLAWKR